MRQRRLKLFFFIALSSVSVAPVWGTVASEQAQIVLRAYEDVDEALSSYRICAEGPNKDVLSIIKEISPVRQKLIAYYGEGQVEIHERTLAWIEPTACREVGSKEDQLKRQLESKLALLLQIMPVSN